MYNFQYLKIVNNLFYFRVIIKGEFDELSIETNAKKHITIN